MVSFVGKVAIITGGASGIGRAIGEEIARRGAIVILADLDGERAEQAAQGITRAGGRARGVSMGRLFTPPAAAVPDQLGRQ